MADKDRDKAKRTPTGCDTDVAARVIRDVAGGRKPDRSYTPEMRDLHRRATADHADHLVKHPGAELVVPEDLPDHATGPMRYSDEAKKTK